VTHNRPDPPLSLSLSLKHHHGDTYRQVSEVSRLVPLGKHIFYIASNPKLYSNVSQNASLQTPPPILQTVLVRISHQPASQPASQPLYQPTIQPTTLPVNHSTSQPASQPLYQPPTLPVNHSTSQPFYQPASQPFYQPTSQPFYQPTS
ncbi:hypothetical protein Ahia01_001418100, partial [Argonauta hians]